MDEKEYKGLSAGEAVQRLADGQGNAQPKGAGKSALQILASNLFTLFNLLNVLLAAALIAVGAYRNLLFMGVVVSNTVIGTVQALRAKRTMDRLELLSTPDVEVIRSGAPVRIPSREVVPDDLLIIRQGDQLCADGVLVRGQGAMNESLLTGESDPVDKRKGDEMMSGSFVTEGEMGVRITRVGADSYAARLVAEARKIEKPASGLMRSMETIVRSVGAAIVPLGLILFVKAYFFQDIAIEEAVTSTVAAMLGMIPEGLVLLTSMALAVGVIRLARKRTLVRELYGIESLARVDVLCVDKTGTLTKGTMDVTGLEPLGCGEADASAALAAMARALDDANATMVAVRARFADDPGWAVQATAPFSSARKWSAAAFVGQGTYILGAAEFILGDAIDPALAARAAVHAAQGQRVLLLCHSDAVIEGKALPGGLVPCALVLLSDVLREDAAQTLEYFAGQGVEVKVISGDNPLTVRRIAQAAGLVGAGAAVDATTLDTPAKLAEAAGLFTVFGRVTPEQKCALVRALKAQGHTVGMIGDGVNDIPALKAADCAIAMAGGSDAARRVSHLTLLDENFAAVPDIVAEGRRVINNISRAASLFLVKTTFSTLLSLLLVFLPQRYPFAPIQMTLISSLTVGIPSFILAMEPNNARVRGNFLANVLRNALPGGLTVVALILVIYAIEGVLGLDMAMQSTMATLTTGFVGLTVLFFTCLPMTVRRAALMAAMTAGFFAAALLLGEVFYLAPLPMPAALATLGMMAATPPLISLMRVAVRRAEAWWMARRKAFAK